MDRSESCVFVIFGASGDLTKRKLIPALYALYDQGLLTDDHAILGVSRTEMSDDAFRSSIGQGIEKFSEIKTNPEKICKFLKMLHYEVIDTQDAPGYMKMGMRLSSIVSERGIKGNYVFYLATPPSMYEVIAVQLADHQMNIQFDGWKRLVIEKPFGYDLDSAVRLNQKLLTRWQEDQIYRIDHYLGKETVQNVLAFRFSNEIFEPLWNGQFIHHIEITSAESIGVENRGKYYDHSGLLRDMVQNHLLQVAGMIAMESPAQFNARSVRNESLKVFEALRPITGNEIEKYVVRGQYTESTIQGHKVPGYRSEKDVPPDSRTETFVAMKFFIDNWRWSGVPFYIRAGKRLPTRVTEVVIHFKPRMHRLFDGNKTAADANQLILRIQPDEGILVKFGMKVPGAGFRIQTVNMDFHYKDLTGVYMSSAYERLLLDCAIGDQTLFTRNDAVEVCWQFIDPILNSWRESPSGKVFGYPAGTWGPKEADALFESDPVQWRFPCKNLTDDGLYCEL